MSCVSGMSSASRNRAYHPITPNTAAVPSAVSSQHSSSVININGNPIEAAFEAQLQKRSNEFKSDLGDRISQIFPRCPPPSSSSHSKGKRLKSKTASETNLNTNPAKKRSGTGKKKTDTEKITKGKGTSIEKKLASPVNNC